ncbi:enoyl-[acyl-carrier-protein] reductase FabK [Clostridium polynesiense]|uniref:enoyl-[acyl-carrier-protein] reductase FabK n=1 Tax=Clostridium polynesiense TaxID=1325933 RepID=UPI00058B8B39|nr:enoyl-[acyl-carrier-protein] reductase FabK [Clostridium polynesiense]
MLETRLTKLLKIKYPIIQGAMAWIADSSLASSVSNAGGLGVIAGANAPVEKVREEIRKTKMLTDKPFAVNIMLMSENAEELARVVVEEKVPVVTTGAGNPGKYIPMWKAAGIKVIPVVPSVALAVRMERAGADAVITEGTEAGGHIGEITTLCLLPQVKDSVNIPVIAAGGIGDGRGLSACLMLGAEGVQIGTRFLVAHECNVHENYKQKVIASKDIDTSVTGRPTGHPVRSIRNKLTRRFQELEKSCEAIESFEELGRGALARAAVQGDVEYGSVMAGQIAGLVSKEQSCREIIDEIIQEAYRTLREITLKYMR